MKPYSFFIIAALFTACTSTSQETSVHTIFDLKTEHSEISGLVFHPTYQKLYMLQDKGNAAELYIYSPEGMFENTLQITNQKNTDWEDLSQDVQGNLYIGDFGNNNNDRKDLRILRIDAASLNQPTADASQITTFFYEDQKEFPPRKNQLMYDCEAFIATDSAFYLFTKNRSKGFDGSFFVYKVPNKEGHFKAEKIAVLKGCSKYKGCAITGAAFNHNTKQLALISHNYIYLLPFLNDNSFRQEQLIIKDLGHISQKESITFKTDTELWIADEKDKTSGGKVYSFNLE